jgi:endonuclease-3
MAKATFDELFPLIKAFLTQTTNQTFNWNTNMLLEKFNGEIPMTVDELVQLPGVGRKTANVITSVVDEQPNMAVDTHVNRVSKRLGLVPLTATTPLAVEKELIKNIPAELVHKAHHWLILHGRYTCTARSPKCTICGLTRECKYYAKELKS